MNPSAALRSLFETQRTAFALGAPDYDHRMAALAKLSDAVHARQEELIGAINTDFGGRAREETLLIELLPLYHQLSHTRKHLKRWMRRRHVRTSWILLPSRAFYQYQPLGVVAVIGAWNYQLLLTLGPLVDAIAAGNHVIVKPSEIAPRSAEVIARIIADAFDHAYVSCITGGPEVTAELTALPFDHIFFTGSGRVGKLIMQAAAQNLAPVTLELGGKSPAIVHSSYPMRRAVERIMTGKCYNGGQTCIAPDYVLVAEGREAEFEAEARRFVTRAYPGLSGNKDYTRIVSVRHFERLHALIDDARQKGARVISLAADLRGANDDRLIPPTLLFDTNNAMIAMQEEIFGPLLPVVSYNALDEAIAYVNARPRPLALYYFDENERRIDHVLACTMSGGVTVNDTIYHIGQQNLPFGGVGPSGMGQYHGLDGFATFSKKRGVMVQRRLSTAKWFRPPYAGKSKMIDLVLNLARRSFMLALAVVLGSCGAWKHALPTGQPEALGFSSAALDSITPQLQAYVDSGKYAGVYAVIVRRGQIVYEQTLGWSDLERRKRLRRNDVFRIYSMTKPVTAAGIMKLAEMGKLGLDDHVAKYIPSFAHLKVFAGGTAAQPILVDAQTPMTVRQLLVHTSGLAYGTTRSPVDTIFLRANVYNAQQTLEQFADSVAKLPLMFSPGQGWNYSSGIDVAARVIEAASGMSYDEFLEEHIFEPLDMEHTGFRKRGYLKKRLAKLYHRAQDGRLEEVSADGLQAMFEPDAKFLWGSGGLLSVPDDYLRFAQMLMNSGELDGIRVLSRESVAQMSRNQLPDSLTPLRSRPSYERGYGYGLAMSVLVDSAQATLPAGIGTYRWSGYVGTYFWNDPRNELIAMVWTQLSPGRTYPLEQHFQRLVYAALNSTK